MRTDTVRVALVLEQHLGHRTFSENLTAAAEVVPGMTTELVPVTYTAALGPIARRLPGAIRAVASARREITAGLAGRQFDVHVVNTQVPAVIGPRAVRAAPYVVCTDITPVQYDHMAVDYAHRPDSGPARALKHRWNRRVLDGAAAAVGWSSWVRDSLVGDYGLDPARCHVIPPGVDTSRFAPGARSGDHPPRILFVGADFERKGGPELLAAFSQLDRGTAELVLVTKSAVPVTEGVSVIADLGPNDSRLVELFATSDVFALPSRAEAFGIAAAEAAAAGLAVIATRSGGLADIVDDGVTGLLVPAREPHALARALRTLVDSPDTRRALGDAGRRRALERFDAAKNAAALLDLARSVAATNGATR